MIPTNLKPQSANDANSRVLVIDGLNTYLRVFTSMQAFSANGEFVGGIIGFLRSIGLNIRDFQPTRCILVFDGKGGSVRRKKLYPEYKANRTGKNGMRMDLFSSVEEEKASMRKQLIRIIHYLNHLPIQIFQVDNVEADDVIAYLTMQYFKSKGSKVRIVSTDRDFYQLIDPNIEVYSPVKKKLYNEKVLFDEFALTPEEYLTYRVVTGDTGDNIPGIGGIGLKTLVKYFPNPTSIERLIQESKQIITEEKKPKQIFKKLIKNEEVLDRNYKLMQLQETDISGMTKINLFNQLESPNLKRTKNYEFRKLLHEDQITTSFKNPDEWLMTTFTGLNVWI